jgi:hypothetical protein
MSESRWRQRVWLPLRAALLLGALAPVSARLQAQARGEPQVGRLPTEVTERVLATWNATDTRRERGRTVIAVGDTIRGPLGVLDGPLIVAGVVLGDVVTINADVRLDSSAVIRGALITVGGGVNGRARGRVDGDLQVWRAALRWREEDGRLVSDEDASLLARYARWRDRSDVDWRDLLVTSAHTYNRVEGLAVLAGPRLQATRGDTRLTIEALGIFRTGDRIAWERENIGCTPRCVWAPTSATWPSARVTSTRSMPSNRGRSVMPRRDSPRSSSRATTATTGTASGATASSAWAARTAAP